MKSYLALIAASLLILVGCQANQTNQNQPLSASQQQAAFAKRLAELNKMDLPQLSDKVAKNEAVIKVVTTQGDITIKLFPELAPLAVENFLTHAKNGYYDGVIFHRVIEGFMIQGGDPLGNGRGGSSIWYGKDQSRDSGNGFRNEPSDLLYNIRGSLAMANAGPNTNGSQFFINQNQDNQSSQLDPKLYPKKIIDRYAQGGSPFLDGGYTVFGQVIDGMAVVDSIAAVPTDDQDKPMEDVTITTIEIIKDYDF